LRRLFPLFLLAACCFSAEPARVDTTAPAGQAFARLYNFDFAGAHAILDGQIRHDPQQPVPYGVKAAAYFFAELYRLKILQMEFFEDDDKVVDRRKLTPNPAVQQDFFRLLAAARARANTLLASQPDNRDALFTLCMAAGLETDYAALIERRRFGSFVLARQTQAYVRRLLAFNPPVYDGYLALGTTEYVVGSLPFFLRWFVRMEDIQGSKERGIATLHLVAERGRYYGPFARILLAAIFMREKRLSEAHQLLAVLASEYPDNPLLRRELQRVAELRLRASAASR
jgi:hypothetical protein